MSHLSLRLLGPPEVRHSGRVLTFRTRKALALLIYLAVEGGMHAREKLTTLFWPESAAARGRTALRRILADLRQSLDDLPEPAHLIIARDALGLDFTSDVDLDIFSLESAFTLIHRPAAAPPAQDDARPNLLTHLHHAAMLWRGSFLEGFSLDHVPDFDDWVRLQHEVWHRRMSAIFDRLAQVQSDGGELAGAIDTTTRWVAHDPLNERAHQRLMQLLFAVGDRTAALQAYETCRATLAEQVQARPAPETAAFAERIRTQALPRQMSGRTLLTPALPPALPEAPLVGRAREFGKLIAAYYAAERGQAQVVVLTGEAGIGKTRLAIEFLGWAAAHGADILQGRAFETGGRLSYQPLVEALRSRIERENAPDDLLSDPWLVELSRLLPELRDRYPDLPPPTADETTARVRLFEATARFVQALAARTPVVLFLDDMHWADAASLDVLHYAGRRWGEGGTPLLVLLCLRTEMLVTAPTLSRWLADVEHDLHVATLMLDALTLEETVQLLQTLAAADPPFSGTIGPRHKTGEGTPSYLQGFGTWLFAETCGQPLYVMETLKALLERGLLALRWVGTSEARKRTPQADTQKWAIDFDAVAHHAAWTAGKGAPASNFLPHGVREVIRSRLDHLTPAAFALLAAGAVLGHDAGFDQLCQIAALGEQEGLAALDEVVSSRLLAEDNGERQALSGTYSFTHDKIRDVVYTEAGEARRRIFHRRALDVLEAAAAPPAERAHHARAAGLPELTFHLSLAAGDAAVEFFAVRDAIAHYEQARRALTEQWGQQNRQSGIPVSAIQHLYVQLGRAYELDSGFEQAHAVYQELLAFASAAGIPTMEGTALNHLATLAAQNPYAWEQARAFLHRALQLARQSGETALWAETEWNLAQLYVYRFDPAAALPHGEQALAFARTLDQQELVARSLNVLTYAKMLAGHWDEAEIMAREAQALYAGLGNRVMEADSLCLIAVNRINTGRPQAALSSAQVAHTMSLEIENTWGLVNSAIPLAIGSLEIGAYAEALAFAELGVNLARKSSMPLLLAFSLTTLGTVQRALIALDAARASHLEAMAMVRPAGLPLLIEVISAELCADCAAQGTWEEAHTHALQALTTRTDTFILSTKLTLWCETEALVRAGEMARATEDVRHFGECIGSSRRYRIPYLRALAALAKFRAEIDVALEHLQEAAALAEEMGLPGEHWPIVATLGELYQARGDAAQAYAAFGRAAEIVQALANGIQEQHLHTRFLSAEQVQRVVEHAATD